MGEGGGEKEKEKERKREKGRERMRNARPLTPNPDSYIIPDDHERTLKD